MKLELAEHFFDDAFGNKGEVEGSCVRGAFFLVFRKRECAVVAPALFCKADKDVKFVIGVHIKAVGKEEDVMFGVHGHIALFAFCKDEVFSAVKEGCAGEPDGERAKGGNIAADAECCGKCVIG